MQRGDRSRGRYQSNDRRGRSEGDYRGGRSRNDEPRGNNRQNSNTFQDKYDQFLTNFVRVNVSDQLVNKYSVSFSPDVESSGLRFRLLNQHEGLIGRTKSFDGTLLYLMRKLPKNELILDCSLHNSATEVQMKIKYLESIEMSKCSHLVSVILKRVLKYLKLQRVGRNYFSPHLNINIENSSISLWPGFSTSLREYEDGLLWNIDTSFKLLRNECVLDLMSQMYFNADDFQLKCSRTLIGCVVITRYNNKTYRIDDIAWDKSPKDTFEWKDGETISFIEYYQKIYQLEIQDTDQPLLINLPKSRESLKFQSKTPLSLISLIPEFCYLTGITEEMRSNFKLMREIARHISGPASGKVSAICQLIDMIEKNPEATSELNSWGLKLSNSLHAVPYKNIAAEPIYGKNPDNALRAEGPGQWHSALRNIQPISTPVLENWICIHTKRDQRIIDDFMNALEQAVVSCNLSFNPPKMLTINDDQTESYLRVIRDEIKRTPNLDLIMTLFPSQREDRYASFKKLVFCNFAIPSQALCTKTIMDQKKLRTVANRVALQINCKLGGELWRVHIPIKNVMVIGIDVNHCNISKAKNSVVGFVSSLNEGLTRWYSKVSFQAQSHEIVQSLRMFISQALTKYYEVNHQLPHRIVVYRDGVGISQIGAAQNLEIQHLQEAFEEFSRDFQPELLFVLIRKRIKTRYFCENSDGNIVNPPPGSVIETSITSNDCPNFYLISQNYTQGTILPINLAVIHNTTSLSMDQIQRFTYKCTYLYYNWSGTVRVPAPCLYAHKVAFMAGQYLNSEPSAELADKLYYL